MKTSAIVVSMLLMACSGSVEDGPGSDCGAAAAPDAAAPAPEPCALTIASLAPAVVELPAAERVTMRGCGFTGASDVQVSAASVPFTVHEDGALSFALPFWRPGDFQTLPAVVRVEVFRGGERSETELAFK